MKFQQARRKITTNSYQNSNSGLDIIPSADNRPIN